MGKINEWITFGYRRLSKSGKTFIWDVCGKNINDSGDGVLGTIQWIARWRTYAFYPHQNTVYEKVCLRLIADFCETQTKKHRAKLKKD